MPQRQPKVRNELCLYGELASTTCCQSLSLSLTGLDQSLPGAGDHGAGTDGVGRQHRPVEEGEELRAQPGVVHPRTEIHCSSGKSFLFTSISHSWHDCADYQLTQLGEGKSEGEDCPTRASSWLSVG